MMESQRSDTEKNNLIEEVKEMALKKLLDRIHEYKAMLSYCLKCKKKY